MARDDTTSAKSRMDKLGVKPGLRVAVVGVRDPGFLEELRVRTVDVSTRRRARCDLLVVGFSDRSDLVRLRTHSRFIAQDGAIWAVWPKGSKDVDEKDVRDAAIAAGLVDVKVVAFSPTLSALKLVTPPANRHRGRD